MGSDRLIETDRRRLLRVTAGNLRQSHIYVRGNYDFFPADCIGPARRSKQESGKIEIELEGLDTSVTTDIARDAKTGKPRGFFRDRSWVRRFFEHHHVRPGADLSLERLSERSYRLSVQPVACKAKPVPTFAEFFSGIGLVRLALERANWRVVFANDIDPKKAEIYNDNWPDDRHLVVGDIHAVRAEDLPDCTMFTASFPCNDLSIAIAIAAALG